MNNKCINHKNEVCVLCSETNCSSCELCMECVRTHDNKHMSFLFSLVEVFNKDGSLNLEKEVKPRYDLNKKIAEDKLQEIELFTSKIADSFSSIFDEFRSKMNNLMEIKKEAILNSIKNYLLRESNQVKVEKERFIKEYDFSQMKTAKVYFDYLRSITNHSNIYLKRVNEEIQNKMNKMSNFVKEFENQTKDQIKNFENFFVEENKKFYEILNSFSQINSYNVPLGDTVVYDKKKENYFLIDKKKKKCIPFKSLKEINNSNSIELVNDFHDLFVFDDVFYLADKSNKLKVVKDGKIIKDLLIDLEILKIHLTLQNNILVIMRSDNYLIFKIYDLNLEYVSSQKYNPKPTFSSILILDDIVYFLSKESSNRNYYRQQTYYYSIVGITGCLSENHIENLDHLIANVQLQFNPSDHFLCLEDKLIYVSEDKIYENKYSKKSFM